MIKAVANLFAGAIGILILLAIAAIAFGINIAMSANTDQEYLNIGVALIVGGFAALFSMGMACVLLDIMFNIRKISENTKVVPYKGGSNTPKTEPEWG